MASYGILPLTFEPNQGQAAPEVQFLARWSGRAYWFTPSEVVLDFPGIEKVVSVAPRPVRLSVPRHTVRISFPGSNPAAHIEGLEPQEGRVNYFVGNDPSQWRTEIPTYRGVVYRNLWDGIDLRYEGLGGNLKYEFVVAPGADPRVIRLAYTGGEDVRVSEAGHLVISTPLGDLVEARPVIYQVKEGERREVEGAYRLVEGGRAGFDVARYDPSLALVIDPLLYSTYLGGTAVDQAFDIAVDGSGNAYVTGHTGSVDFPTASPFQGANAGAVDVFVTKLNAAGSALVYSTYLGGAGADEGHGIALDGSNNAYVTGFTTSANFPTQAPVQGALSGATDAFVTKLNPAGSALVYSTYLGGTGTENTPPFSGAIAVDGSNNAYVTGATFSLDFPTAAPFQAANGGVVDAFVTKLNAAGSALTYSTYLGGTSLDLGSALVVDGSGNAYVTGTTFSPDFPTASAFQAGFGGIQDAFVTKLNPAGSALVYSTYLGGSAPENIFFDGGIAVDGAGSAYVTGSTLSANFPTAAAFQAVYGLGVDAFVTKLTPAGSALVYSTYLGGVSVDGGGGIAVDSSGNAYVTGQAGGLGFPTASADQPVLGGPIDAFVTVFNAAGSALTYSTFLGGSGIENATPGVQGDIALDSAGNAYVTGDTTSLDFPTAVPFQTINAGPQDAFVAKIQPGIPDIAVAPAPTDFGSVAVGTSSSAQTFTVSNSGNFRLNVGAASLSGAHPADFALQSDTASGTTINPAGSATLEVVFQPTAAGARSASLLIPSNDPDEDPVSLALHGTGLVFPDIAAFPAAVDFGSVFVGESTPPQTFTVRNNGTGTLTIGTIGLTGTDAAEFALSGDSASGVSLTPGGSATLQVTFSPTSAGAKSAFVSIPSDDPDTNPLTIALQGAGEERPGPELASGPDIAAYPAGVDFGTVKRRSSTPPQVFSVLNVGSTDLAVGSASLSGADAADFVLQNDSASSATVVPLGSASLEVVFRPRSRGAKTASLLIPSDDPDENPVTISLQGRGKGKKKAKKHRKGKRRKARRRGRRR